MKMRNRVTDERILAEENRIYKICFYVLCGGLFLDLIVKFNLYRFSETAGETWVSFGLETVFLVAVFYINLFLLARRGIAFAAADIETDRFPRRRYACVAGGLALLLSLGMWTVRFSVGSWEYGLPAAILFCGAIYLLTFVLAFLLLYGSFYIAFCIARQNAA